MRQDREDPAVGVGRRQELELGEDARDVRLERVVIAGSKHTDFTDLGLTWGPLTRIASLGSIASGRMWSSPISRTTR